MSPALLSKRLRELQNLGVVRRELDTSTGTPVYRLTESGEDLRLVVMAIGTWGQRWLEGQLSLKNLDPSLLMWDMRRNLNPKPLPPRRVVIQFVYPEIATNRECWWLVEHNVNGRGEVDLCMINPGHEVDLYVVTDLRTMMAIWMGLTSPKFPP